MRVLPVGQSAILFEVDDLHQAEELYAELRRRQQDDAGQDLTEIVPAARTVLVVARAGSRRFLSLAAELMDWQPSGTDRLIGARHELPTRYDGEDLSFVSEYSGLTENEVIDLHADTEYRVAFCGFAPGFAYLAGVPPILQMPRRTSPRTSVPTGSVALAGEFAAVYPRESPGGWQLIGRTEVPMWNSRSDPPALLNPGDRVRFVPCRA